MMRTSRRCRALLLGLALLAGPGLGRGAEPAKPALTDPAEMALWTSISTKVQQSVAGWSAGGLRSSGQLVDQRWCRPPVGPEACAAGSMPRDPAADAGVARLGWLSTGRPGGDFGVNYAVVDLPPQGLGLRLSLTVGGRGLVGDQLSLRWQRVPAQNDAPDALRLGSSLQWTVGEQQVEVAMPGVGGPAAALTALAESPEALQRRGGAHLAALEAAVETALQGDTLRFCELGPYEGDGLPPVCTPRPLTEAERAAERARLAETVGRWRATLQAEGPALHAALVRWSP